MIQIEEHTRRKLIWVGAVLAPLTSVQVARLLDGPGLTAAPAAVAASQVPDPTSVQPVKPLTGEQQRALAFIETYRPSATLVSPMDCPDPIIAPPPLPTAAPAVLTVVKHMGDVLAGLSVSAIMGTDDAAVALIAHKLRRVGDEVVQGWRVKSIDPHNRRVVLVNDEGAEAQLTPPTPGE